MGLKLFDKKQKERQEKNSEGEESDESDDNISASFGSAKTEYSYPVLVMERVQDCCRKRAVEMKKGNYIDKIDKFYNTISVWVEDTRVIYINSVKSLKLLLAPKIKQDKEFPMTEINNKLNQALEKYGCFQMVYKKDNLGNSIPDKDKTNQWVKYIPEIDERIMTSTGGWSEKGIWNSEVNQYIDFCLDIYDELFEELNCLIERLGYFKKRLKFG